VLAARFDVTVTSSSGGSAVVRYTQKALAELNPVVVGILGLDSSPFAHAKAGATILNSEGGERQGLKLAVTGSSEGAMKLLEKAADRSTRDELTTAEITDVLAAKFDVTATSSSGGSVDVCYTQKTLAELHPVLLGSSSTGKKYDKTGLYSQPTKNKAKLKTSKMFPHVKHAIAPHKLGWY
jgi:hypothetical protein